MAPQLKEQEKVQKGSYGLTPDNINSNMLNIRYAVRGPLVKRAEVLEMELLQGAVKPFKRVVRANVGDCHALGQKPITYIRQVVALVSCPQLISSLDFPEDVKRRAEDLLRGCTQGSAGSYSPPEGLRVVRESAAQYVSNRDGVPAEPNNFYIGAGASDLVKGVLQLLAEPVDGRPPAVMIPCPQYPLFSGVLAELGIHAVHYQLNESKGWTVELEELRRSWLSANETHYVRALVLINPGNPTGQVLSIENLKDVVSFALETGLLLLADEVYQENIVKKPFHSCKKVASDIGALDRGLQLASVVTLSKGWAAECGLRAAYIELCGLPSNVHSTFLASRALLQCAPVLSQCALQCALSPPKVGEPSYEKFVKERRSIQRLLERNSLVAQTTLDDIPGISCNAIEASMFAFPRIEISTAACEAARTNGLKPDEFYCSRLLEETGVCVVPGSGFGQAIDTYHFRTTILHTQDELQHILNSIGNFHQKFTKFYE